MEILDVLRQEKKYLLSIEQTERMRRSLGRVLEEDAHARQGGYLVRSLYFDTPDDMDFREKSDGIGERRKIRLRIYDPGDKRLSRTSSSARSVTTSERWDAIASTRSLNLTLRWM